MSCEQYRDALTDVAAGGPAPAGLEAHLASCDGCREQMAALRRVLAIADVEIARLVGAEPSPALAARIRTSIAQSGSGRAWRVGWLWPALAASAALLLAAVWLTRAPSPARVALDSKPAATPGESRPAAQPGRTGQAPERTSSSSGTQALPTRAGSRTPTLPHRRSPARSAPAAPEVLVPPGEAEALVRFAAIVHRDRHAPAALLAAGRPSADLAEPAELVITPLEIVPLEPAETPGT